MQNDTMELTLITADPC